VLFSREDVADVLHRQFEAAWEMVRPVPIVRIDFGNGDIVTRTLHGNVASYVCTADGQVMDILPGIYQPAAYTAALVDPRALAVAVRTLDTTQKQAQLREYHRSKLQRLRNPQPAAPNPQQPRIPDRGKGTFERPLENQIVQYQAQIQRANAARRPRNAAELANWLPLAEDTVLNETVRRLQIHERFATANAVRPNDIKVWLYRDVLHADLEDPRMGLGDDLFTDVERS
jgi:hypothetical protein